MQGRWPDDFVWQHAVAPPEQWDVNNTRPGLVMFFNLECPGCISRGIPFLKQLTRDYPQLISLLIHTDYGHKHYEREDVVPTLTHFAKDFARLSVPVALDINGIIAKSWQIQGTPHWLLFSPDGVLNKSIYGSQDNARQRLEYALEELLPADIHKNAD